MKKYERDKYLFIFEYKYFKGMIENKFEILDVIKEIQIGNKIPVTLSIGFGLNGGSLLNNFQNASAGIDIALGRGGDQVVAKNNGNISFYGGTTKEPEKRTKVKARVISFALRQLIDQSNEIMIMGHQNCDIDSLGAALGLYRFIRQRGRTANIVLNQVNPTITNIMNKVEEKP